MMSLTFGLFTQVSDSGPHGPLVYNKLPGEQGLTNQKSFLLPTGQVKKQITCPIEKLSCPDSLFQK